ncbi:hypothetical protein Xinn_04125 [Xenorhabdus innexi]|uniref:Uncharacterized protein n=1 Tax=Xenorhabdus innexi TaxID=290109 RepID=A0A2G0MKZ6_9GAMM|nr:hypothetical protein Xinn_04125 [Xenorhabdus innexi]
MPASGQQIPLTLTILPPGLPAPAGHCPTIALPAQDKSADTVLQGVHCFAIIAEDIAGAGALLTIHQLIGVENSPCCLPTGGT